MSGAGTSIRFQNRVKSIEVTSKNSAQQADSKLGRAAAGAVLGFLIAGPAGTLLGAGSIAAALPSEPAWHFAPADRRTAGGNGLRRLTRGRCPSVMQEW
jgi:hypothetical protein